MVDSDDISSRAHGVLGETWRTPASTRQRLAQGRALRERIPRRALGALTPRARDPLAILTAQNANRLADLVPLRRERMAASAFAFYRGTAAIMADDLGAEEHSGILIPACGDAHLANFGFYASPQRRLVFDLNDFDESAWAPWEWDLKRLVASIVIAGQASARDETVTTDAARTAVRAYAAAIRGAIERGPIERFFTHFDAAAGIEGMDKPSRRVLEAAVRDARRRTGERAARRLTTMGADGRRVFVETPPTMTHADAEIEARVQAYFRAYIESTQADIRQLMQNYTIADVARRVVGVGSVGTRCALVLLQDGDANTLVMQSKQAQRSVLEQYGGITQPRMLRERIDAHGEGARVVALQRVLQAVSDPLLGFLRTDDVDLYVRQFHDMKGSLDAETLDDGPFATYAQACAVTLARAHSQSPQTALIAGYVGSGRVLAETLVAWAYAYAELSRADHAAFVDADLDSMPAGEPITAAGDSPSPRR